MLSGNTKKNMKRWKEHEKDMKRKMCVEYQRVKINRGRQGCHSADGARWGESWAEGIRDVELFVVTDGRECRALGHEAFFVLCFHWRFFSNYKSSTRLL